MSAVPHTGPEPYVFVSYPREDIDLVREELDRLADFGIRVDFSLDEAEVEEDRIKNAAAYLVLVSDSTEDDPHLRKEVSLALQEGKDGLCVHVFDVPLDGPIKLLLGSLPQVTRPLPGSADYSAKERGYVRRLVQALPDDVKSRPITLPGDELVQPPPPSRSNEEISGGEGLAGLGNAGLSAVAALAVLVVLGIAYVATSGGDPEPTPAPTASAPDDDDGPRPKGTFRPLGTPTPSAPDPADEARDALLKAIPLARAAIDADTPNKALEHLAALDAAALPKDAKGRATGHLLRGRALRKLGKFKEAAADYDKAVPKDTKDAELLSERADLRHTLGNLEGALEDLGAALKLSDQDPFMWAARGEIHVELKKYEEAVADFTKAIELAPKRKTNYLKRAQAYDKLGKSEEAEADRQKAAFGG